MTTRRAVRADLDTMVAMGREFLATVYPQRLADNPDALRALGEQLLARPDSVLFVAEVPHAGVVGMIGMMVYPHPMSGERVASELFWWMDPAHRGAGGVWLLRQAEAWAQVQGAELLQMIAPNRDVAAFYERIGFTAIETTYLRRLDA